MAINQCQQRKAGHEQRRRQRDQCRLSGNSRQLRSGKGVSPRTVSLSSIRVRGRRHPKRLASLVSADANPATEEVALERPQRCGEGSHDMSVPCSDSVGSRTQPLAMESVDVRESSAQGDNPREGRPAGELMEDVGIPADEKWDMKAAYDKRHCPAHGDEWLLQYHDKWMYPSDFNYDGAKAELKKMHQHYLSTASTSKPQNEASIVECNCSCLWSEVDTPVQHDGIRGMYLIKWKIRWTPESDINDLPWVKDSYEGQNVIDKGYCNDQISDAAQATVASEKSIMALE